MSHEKSITIGVDGGYVNIPTVIDGQEMEPKKAMRAFEAGKVKPLGGRKYKTEKEAVEAAKERSKNATKKKDITDVVRVK